MAAANLDGAAVGQLMRQETALQVQAAQESADAARPEVQAIRDAASARETELRATGQRTTVKRDDIEAARRSADLKDIEGHKTDILAQKIQALADSEQARTAVLEKQIETQEKALQQAERQRALEERKKTAFDTAGNVVNAQGETLTSIMGTLKGYGLSEDADRREAQKFINPNGRVNYGAGHSLGGLSLSDTLRIVAERARAGGAPVGVAKPAAGASRTVNINIAGQKTAINVASQGTPTPWSGCFGSWRATARVRLSELPPKPQRAV